MAFSTPRYRRSLQGWSACNERLPPVAAEVSIAYIGRSQRKTLEPSAYTFEHNVLFDGMRWLRKDGEPLHSRWRVDYWKDSASSSN